MTQSPEVGSVVAVCRKEDRGMRKNIVDVIVLDETYGIAGDYHSIRFKRECEEEGKDPSQPDLRQVLLVDTAIYAELAALGIPLAYGNLGENMVVDGVKIMSLPVGTQLKIGETLLELTVIRHPCKQLNEIHPDLLKAVVKKCGDTVQFNAGMLARILKGGSVRPMDELVIVRQP